MNKPLALQRIEAIQSLVPGAQIVITGDQITWVNPPEAPVTEEEIETEIQRLLSMQNEGN